jgi:rhodanese-related sulfurtransferase
MPSYLEISFEQLNRLVGTPTAPVIVDVRTEEDFALDPRLVPGSVRRSHEDVASWVNAIDAKAVVAVCQRGAKLSHGVAAYLRNAGIAAESLEGGFEAWSAAGGIAVPEDKLPPRDVLGRTVWVTRARPKIDRIACPWLIRRFVDPAAVFLYVAAAEVTAVAERFTATPFDIDDTFWSHRGEMCTFDTMLKEFGLKSDALDRLALIVRGADTARPDIAPEAAGLHAISLGLSQLAGDGDHGLLERGFMVYDALFAWLRFAADERHNWPARA